MIKIKTISEEIVENHYQYFLKEKKAILVVAVNEAVRNSTEEKIYQFLCNNFEKIIKSKPSELRNIITKWNNEIQYEFNEKSDEDKAILARVNEVFNYVSFSKDKNEFKTANGKKVSINAYTHTKNLGLSSCPYCNRLFCHTILDETQSIEKHRRILRPDLDHFYPKVKYPFLSVSFYNLVPSCNICNSRFKLDKDFYKDYNCLNPFEEGFVNETKFKVKIEDITFFQGKSEKCKIELQILDENLKDRIEENKKAFKIETVYQEHKDYAYELIHKSMIYSDDYLNDLYKQYEGTIFKNREDLVRMVAANYIDDEDLHLRPLSKLTKDVIEQFGLW
jgi:hypothetical protein